MTPSSTHSLLEEPLEDLLLALEVRAESAQVRVQTAVGPALVSVNEGRLSEAVFGAQVGPQAIKHLLSHKEGTYTFAPTAMSDIASSPPEVRNFPKLSKIIREKEKKSTRIGASGQRSAIRMRGVLVRTPKALPSGLSAVELKALASVDGRTSVLNLMRTLRDPVLESLQAFRRLLQIGLVVEGGTALYAPTLSMGTNESMATGDARDGGSTSPIRARRITPVANDAGSVDDDDLSSQEPQYTRYEVESHPEQEQLKRKATGRWAKSPEKRVRLNSTGYSSVPPPALATDQVSLPRSPRDSDRYRRSEPQSTVHSESETLGAFSTENHESEGELSIPLVSRRILPREPVRHDTPTALSTATVRAERTFPEQRYELRESEIPVPSTRLDTATLEQLDELDAALRSSRRPNLPDFRPPSSKGKPPSEPGPPPSLGLGIPLGELPPPGSVPYPQELPGDTAEDSVSGLPRVGRYEVLARLKRGGMGSIYMCRLSGTAGFRRLFAMKVLHGHLAAQSDSLEAFFHEARVLGELHHPNIVGIADVGTPQEPYIVMDYVEGGSLAELFRATSGGRDPAPTITVVLDALNGLAYAHSASDDNGQPLELVHHDVTPHNLLVGIDGSCRVTDFGIARTRKEAGDPSIIQGKPAYLAPERLRQAPADHRADVFSMGVVLYLGLTGQEPFRGASPEETTQLILHGKISVPSEVGFRPPPALDWICMTALARDPEARFSSAEEMAAQLRRVAERSGLIAPVADVASWVRASLGPILAARRAASMRGTGATDPPPAVASVPPPRYEERRVPSDAPSAAETTGPLEPPNSRAFDDNTEILPGAPQQSASSGQPDPRRRYLVYSALILAAAVTIWAISDPTGSGKFFKRTDPASAGSEEGVPGSEQTRPLGETAGPGSSPGEPAPKTPERTGTRVEIDDDGKVVLPPIQPSGSK